MKKQTAWQLWLLSAGAVTYSLYKMFWGTEHWIFYAIVVGVGFYFTRKIFNEHLAH